MELENNTDAQFYTLANLMPTLCWMANADGWIFWYNSRWFEYTGTTPDQMEGWGWQSVHDPAVLPDVLKEWKSSIESGLPFEMTFPLKSATGVFRPFLTRVTPVRGSDDRIFRWLGVNTDIGDERAGLELREQFMAVLGRDLRNPLNAISSGLSVLRKTSLDERALRVVCMMHDSATRMIGLLDDVMDMTHSGRGGGLELKRDASQTPKPALREVIAELLASLPDRVVESEFTFTDPVNCDRGRVAQLLSNQMQGLYALATDVTEVRESYRRIRELAQRLETVREEERRASAQFLHEGIAQDLFAMKLGLDHLKAQALGRTGVAEMCRELADAINHCMRTTRQIAQGFWPSALIHLRLAVAIEEHARHFGGISGLIIRVVEMVPFPDLDQATGLIFFRAAQEALTNVARHARAASVDVVLCADSDSITMNITDDGVGIEEAALTKADCLGLLGLRERVSALGGALAVRRNAGAGTTVSVHLPRSMGSSDE